MVFDSFKNYLEEIGLLNYNDKIYFNAHNNKVLALKNYLNKALISDENYLDNICNRIYNTYIIKNLSSKLQSLEIMVDTICNKFNKERGNIFEKLRKFKFKFQVNKNTNANFKKEKSKTKNTYKFTKTKIEKETKSLEEIEANFPSLRNIITKDICQNTSIPISIKSFSYIKLNEKNKYNDDINHNISENNSNYFNSFIPITFRSRQDVLNSNKIKRNFNSIIKNNSEKDREYTFRPNLNKYNHNKYDGYEFQTINNLNCLDEKSYNESSLNLKVNEKNKNEKSTNYLNIILKEHTIKYK